MARETEEVDSPGRRNALETMKGGLAAAVTAGLAGCGAVSDSGESSEHTPDTDTRTLPETSTRTPTATPTESPTPTDTATPTSTEEPEMTQEEFEEVLKADLFTVGQSLSAKHHHAPYERNIVEMPIEGDGNYTVQIHESLDQLLDLSGESGFADLYVASRFGLVDEVIGDALGELRETAEVIDAEFEDTIAAAEETGYNVSVGMIVHDRVGNDIGRRWDLGESTANKRLDDLYHDAKQSGQNQPIGGMSGDFNDYDDMTFISESRPIEYHVRDHQTGESTSYTVEYESTVETQEGDVGNLTIKKDGEVVDRMEVEEYESFSLGDDEVELDRVNPVYVQDREDVEDGAILRF